MVLFVVQLLIYVEYNFKKDNYIIDFLQKWES